MNDLPFQCMEEGCILQFTTKAQYVIHICNHLKRPQVSGESSKTALARPPQMTRPPSKGVAPMRPVASSGPGSISVNNRDGPARKRPKHCQESTSKEYHALSGKDREEIFQNKAKASKDQETTTPMMSTSNNRTPAKPISHSATEPQKHPFIVILSDSDEEIKYPKHPKNSQLTDKPVTPNHNGVKKSSPITQTKRSTTVLKEGFSRKRTGWKRPKVDLEPASYCQWNQQVRKKEEEQQGGQWKNVISQDCDAAFRNPRNLVDHYLNHLRQLHGTIECPVKDCRMLLRSSMGLKAHNRLFHRKTSGRKYTKPSSSPVSSSTLMATRPSVSAVNGGRSVATQMTHSSTPPTKRISVSDFKMLPNHDKQKYALKKRLKDENVGISTISDFSSSPPLTDHGRSNGSDIVSNNVSNTNTDNNNNNNVDNNDHNNDGDRTEPDDDNMSQGDNSVNSKNYGQLARKPIYVSDSEGNSLPEVLGPFFTWLRKK